MGYSWGVHGVFVGYTYVSGMCRVCIGNVSGMCRERIERNKVRVGSLTAELKRIEAPARCAHEI